MVAVDGFNTCVCADISAHIHWFTKCMGATLVVRCIEAIELFMHCG